MTQICKRCNRVNPREASFCWYDGHLLAIGGNSGDSVALDVGARPFASPFFMPTGRPCKNFNELVLACQEDSAGALELLRKGYLELFLAGQGRMDLADAARAAAKAADGERGLDEFLGQLPGTALTPSRLQAEPETVDLGTLSPGEDRRFELTLRNGGMRLLSGSASCEDCRWLVLGDAASQRRKIFQFSKSLVLPVQVLGRQVGAYAKHQQAEIRLESSGGVVSVAVRMFVPVRPFPDGVLAGSMSPRQMAEQARESPREAASLIESGAVRRWYEANGWTYPVTGPSASGLACVQQLFEALGLARPPRVELGAQTISLSGVPGAKVEYVLAAVTQENRAVAAFGASDQPWLEISPPVSRGRSALLSLTVPAVPDRPGETLRATLTVTANGGQRFEVAVLLCVTGQAGDPKRRQSPTPESPLALLPALPPLPPFGESADLTRAPSPTPAWPINNESAPTQQDARRRKGCAIWLFLAALLLSGALAIAVSRDSLSSLF